VRPAGVSDQTQALEIRAFTRQELEQNADVYDPVSIQAECLKVVEARPCLECLFVFEKRVFCKLVSVQNQVTELFRVVGDHIDGKLSESEICAVDEPNFGSDDHTEKQVRVRKTQNGSIRVVSGCTN